jgi:GDSL-like Lipase/Acylhydrolase family
MMTQDTRIEGKRQFRLKMLLFFSSLIVTTTLMYLCWHLMFPARVIRVGTTNTPKAKLYGWALEPFQSYSSPNPDTGAPIAFASNSAGWRDVAHEIAKPAGVFRIVVIGDSVTCGSVSLESLYTRQLERILRQTGMKSEIITIGVGGWSTDQELEALRLEGIRYQPDLVVIQFNGNDPVGNESPYIDLDRKDLTWNKLFRYELNANGRLIRIQPMIPNSKVPDLESAIRLTAALLGEAKRVSKEAGSDFLVFAETPYSYMQKLCDSALVDCYIPKQGYTRYKNDSHYNAVGNTEMAIDLAKYVLNRYRPELKGHANDQK